MKKKVLWLLMSFIMMFSLVIASCSTGEETGGKVTEKDTGQTVTVGAEEEKEVVKEQEEEKIPFKGTGAWWDKFGEAQYGGTVTSRIASSPPHFDPYLGMGPSSIWLETLGMRDWAVDRDEWAHNVMYIPAEYSTGLLAESWEWPDMSTVIFHLREGVKWADNPYSEASALLNSREFTADDVEWSFSRYHGLNEFEGKASAYRETPLMVIAGVKALDKYTVEFKAAYPSFDMRDILLETLPGLQIVAREVVEKWGDMNNWQHIASTGPYMMADYISDSFITMVKNPNYYGYHEWYPENQLPYADKWELLVIPDVATSMAAMRTGKVDLIEDLSWEQADNLARTNPEILQATLPIDGYTLDMRCDMEPFTNIKVRQALQMSIDLETIAATYYGGYVEAKVMGFTGTPGFQTPYDEWSQELKDGYTYNPEGAKALLAEAGYPNGFSTNVVAQTTDDLDLLQVVKSYFSKINVEMEIKVMDPAAFSSFTLAGKHEQMAYNWNVGLMWPPAYTGLEYYSKHFRNFSHPNDATYDGLFEQQIGATNKEERQQLLIQMNDRVLEQYWSVRILPRVQINVYQPWLKGYSGELSATQMYYAARYWVNKSEKEALGH
ncbi:MAG: ABC transporter substrate-binding protein [Dehalococcoidales bacterium]|nr:ABC transporter substrate-binding protein [Dehalococcoidales bacterium]